jgi:hypothetical protein
LVVVFQLGCGSNGSPASLGEVGTYDPDAGGSFLRDDASNSAGLDAYIEQNHVAVRLITLSCSGQCATVEAVATGGTPPYSFRWDDGSTNPVRLVCPNSSTNYHVQVTDTATTGELARPAETGQASLTADVLACPDGGRADAAASPEGGDMDATSDAGAASCVASGGPLVTGCETLDISLPPFQKCPSGNILDPVRACLPQPLVAGRNYSILMTLNGVIVAGSPEGLVLSGGQADCSALQTFASYTVTASGTVSVPSCVQVASDFPALLFQDVLMGSFHATTWTSATVQVCAGCGAE